MQLPQKSVFNKSDEESLMLLRMPRAYIYAKLKIGNMKSLPTKFYVLNSHQIRPLVLNANIKSISECAETI